MSGDFLLVLDRRDLLVRPEGKSLRIERPNQPVQRVPLASLGLLVVYGAPVVSCDVWRLLAQRSIPAVLLPLRGAGPVVWMGNGLSNTIQVRCLQHQQGAQSSSAVTIARDILHLKISLQLRLVQGLGAALEADLLQASLSEKQTALASMDTIEALMGVEGSAAAAWYGWLAKSLPAHWRFGGRNRRPPLDPLNALLSLGYTLVGAEMQSVVQEAGLDPALGFLHGVVPGRASLVLDLIEPLRPGVDAFALALLDETLRPEHFQMSSKLGCRLDKSARGLFFAAWGRARWNWPLPISPFAGMSLDASEPELSTDSKTETVGDNSLRAQCRRMVRVLRTRLRQQGEVAND